MRALTGREGKPVVDLPKYLNRVSEVTWNSWGLTGTEIANQLTLFPLFSWPLRDDKARICLEKILGTRGSVHSGLKATGMQVMHPTRMRICPACREEDLAQFGETYWHRTHQIPGSLICPAHQAFLLDTNVWYNNRSTHYWQDANYSITSSISSANKFNTLQTLQASAISALLSSMLHGELIKPEEPMKDYYATRAFESGLTNSTNFIQRDNFITPFLKLYNSEFLLTLGLPSLTDSKNCWLYQALRNSNFQIHPVHHALLSLFFDIREKTPPPMGYGPFLCLNAECRSKGRTAAVILLRRTPTGVVATAKCRCGFVFDFCDTKPYDRTAPENPIIKIFSPALTETVRDLHTSGATANDISCKLSIPTQLVNRVLDSSDPLGTPIDERLLYNLRDEWRKAIVVANNSINTAIRDNPQLYETLRMHAREWLNRFNRGSNRHPPPPQHAMRAFTPARDLDWSARVEQAVENEERHRDNRAITFGILAMQAGLNFEAIQENSNLLPLTLAALKRGIARLSKGDFR